MAVPCSQSDAGTLSVEVTPTGSGNVPAGHRAVLCQMAPSQNTSRSVLLMQKPSISISSHEENRRAQDLGSHKRKTSSQSTSWGHTSGQHIKEAFLAMKITEPWISQTQRTSPKQRCALTDICSLKWCLLLCLSASSPGSRREGSGSAIKPLKD